MGPTPSSFQYNAIIRTLDWCWFLKVKDFSIRIMKGYHYYIYSFSPVPGRKLISINTYNFLVNPEYNRWEYTTFCHIQLADWPCVCQQGPIES